MAEWVWEARARSGEIRKGVMDAEDKDSVTERLKSQNLNVVAIRRKAGPIKLQFGSPVTPQELVVFIRQFATMIDAGLPLVQCLDILSSQGENNTSALGSGSLASRARTTVASARLPPAESPLSTILSAV